MQNKRIEQGDTLFFENNVNVAVYDNSESRDRCVFDYMESCPNNLSDDYNIDCYESKIIFKKVLTKLSE